MAEKVGVKGVRRNNKGEPLLKGDPPFGLAVLFGSLNLRKKSSFMGVECSAVSALHYFHPPPRDRYNSTTAPNWLRWMAARFNSACSALVWAVITSR